VKEVRLRDSRMSYADALERSVNSV